VLIKYYLEDWNDRQIAESLGAHINTVNQKRRDAVELLCEELGMNKDNIKRSRKSGKKASLPTAI
jgi:DNA-directed RNA polymerase specialized sigma24 family protein